MAGTLDMCRNISTRSAEEAIEILYGESVYPSVILYNSSQSELYKEVDKVYAEIKRRNAEIPDVKQQMLPSSPYSWEDIDGCLHVYCVEITMNTFEHNSGGINLFSGWNYDVLTNPEARSPLSGNTMAALAMLGSMV